MDLLQESGWEELRKDARKIKGDLDVKLSSYAKLGASFTQEGSVDSGSPTVGSSRSCKSMEMEIQSLLKKLLDTNDAMSRCAASAAPTTSVAQKIARHRDILHEFTQRDMVSLSQGVGSKSGPIPRNEAFRRILGTKKGYERGLGYGVKPTQSTRSNRAEVKVANKRANEVEERAQNAEMMALEALEKVKEMDELRTTMEQHIHAFNDMMARKSPVDLGTED